MPAKKYVVELSDEERAELRDLTSKGSLSARKMKRSQILLKADEGWKDKEIIQALNTSRSTVERTRRRYVEGGLEKALNEDPRLHTTTNRSSRGPTPPLGSHVAAWQLQEAPAATRPTSAPHPPDRASPLETSRGLSSPFLGRNLCLPLQDHLRRPTHGALPGGSDCRGSHQVQGSQHHDPSWSA